MKTMWKFYTCIVMLALLQFRLAAQTVTINVNQPHQTIDGVGFCHEGNRLDGDTYVISPAIQEMLDNNMTLFRDMFPNRTFAISRGNYGYSNQRVINSYLRLKEMQNRGITTILGIWDMPNWLVSNPNNGDNRHINNFDDFADVVTAFLVHGKNNYGLTVNYIDINETKTSGVNLALTSAEYVTFIQKCQTRFTAAGLQTKVNLGSVLLWDLQYCQEIYNQVRTLSVAGHPSWHSYRGGSLSGEQREPIARWQEWGAWQQTIDRTLWATETDYDAFYWRERNPDVDRWTGAQEMAVMYYRNYYVSRVSTSAGWFWHKEYPSHNVHRAYMNNFEPGGQVVETSQPDGAVMTVAYRHVAKNKFVIQVLNDASTAKTVTFSGVPANQPLKLVRTSEAGDRYTTVGTYTPSGSNFTITLQPNSFNTFTGNLSSGPPPTTVATVYADCNYTGQAVSLNTGDYTLAQLQAAGVTNDNISSLQVQSGYQVTLFADNNFAGASAVVTADDACLVDNSFNDLTTSLRITTVSTPAIVIQAESYSNMSGVTLEICSDTGGGQNTGSMDANDWLTYSNINVPTTGSYIVQYRVASLNGGAQLQLEKGGTTTVYGSVNVPATGGWQTWSTVQHTVTLTAGVQNFGIKVLASGANLNWFSLTPASSAAATSLQLDAQAVQGEQRPRNVYPSPASDVLNIKTGIASGTSTVTIRSLDGNVLYKKEVSGSLVTVNVKEVHYKGTVVISVVNQQTAFSEKIMLD